ncbi:hypothetical protein Glove_102g94 [Diversispora epigaea]|uniref:Uncharacterized protein n=1 Tax=Diversispora epigaea TaxID=1348612 RepID=A0A397JAF2_9GLOM|nr:hypothetical protein Glove_102g94 [Diversispora epigaea]
MRIDLAKHTLSKEIEDAMASIEELKEISEGTRNFIKNSREYRLIMHSDKQKTGSKEWISSQCQFDIILSINGFLEMLSFFLKNYPDSIIQPKCISQDTLEGLFGTIQLMGGDASTQILKSYSHALNKYQIIALVSFEVKSINYGKADCNGFGITTLARRYITNFFIICFEYNNLIMGKISIPLEVHNENIKQENFKIQYLQNERNSIQNHSDTYFSMDLYLVLQKIIKFEPAEASKFSYIIGWIIYKLTKNDYMTRSHPKFETICIHLKILNLEVIVYDQNIRSQVTNIIPEQDFLDFMYRMESIVLLLFEKREKFSSNILQYIYNNTNNNISIELTDETKDFLYERIISIYVKSRQKSWRKFNKFIPEKATSSLRENLKVIYKDIKIENKLASIKKFNIPKDPIFGLNQLQIWTHLVDAEKEFSKIFLISELQWLLWTFGDNSRNK